MSGEALKPCPFCGGEPKATTDSGGIIRAIHHTIRCTECNAGGHRSMVHTEAVDGWNLRTNDWQPIATAPKGVVGTQILAMVDGHVTICTWGKASHVPWYGWIPPCDVEDAEIVQPTHWIPLPNAPAEQP